MIYIDNMIYICLDYIYPNITITKKTYEYDVIYTGITNINNQHQYSTYTKHKCICYINSIRCVT